MKWLVYTMRETKKIISHILLWCLFIFVSLLFISPDLQAKERKRVFILHSYEKDHVCGQPQHDGVIESLSRSGFQVGDNLEVQTYYMDTKRTNTSAKLMARQATAALEEINIFSPDVLVTIDDNAYRTVALQLIDSPVAIVFSGLNGQPRAYNTIAKAVETWEKPGHNVTGIYEKLYFVEALHVHEKLFPSFGRTLVLIDTSPTGKAIKRQIELEIQGKSLPGEVEIKVVGSFEDYKKEVLRASSDPETGALYPAALILTDKSGKTYTAPKIFSWTIKNSTRPEIALNYSFTRMGLFGGAAVDFFAMGQQAGELAGEILLGRDAGTIPIRKAEKFALAFNLGRANSLGIQLPSDILLAADEIVQPQ